MAMGRGTAEPPSRLTVYLSVRGSLKLNYGPFFCSTPRASSVPQQQVGILDQMSTARHAAPRYRLTPNAGH